jgi:hypothetical protein
MENSRRNFIKTTAIASFAAAAVPAKSFAILHKDIQPDEQTIGHNGFTYKVDKNWAKISVTNTPLANCHEMVQDSKGRLIMLGDHTHNNVLIFDKSGKLLDYWGTALPGGHGLSISKEGRRRLFVTNGLRLGFRPYREYLRPIGPGVKNHCGW